MITSPLIFTKHRIFGENENFRILFTTSSWRHFWQNFWARFLFSKISRNQHQKARKMNSQFRTRALSKYGNCQIIKPAFMGLKLVRNNFEMSKKVIFRSKAGQNDQKINTTDRVRQTSGPVRPHVRIEMVEPVVIGSFCEIEVAWKNMFWDICKSDQNDYVSIYKLRSFLWTFMVYTENSYFKIKIVCNRLNVVIHHIGNQQVGCIAICQHFLRNLAGVRPGP